MTEPTKKSDSLNLLLTDEKIKDCYRRTKFPSPKAVEKEICKTQVQHLISLGWKSPEEVEALLADERAKIAEWLHNKPVCYFGEDACVLVNLKDIEQLKQGKE